MRWTIFFLMPLSLYSFNFTPLQKVPYFFEDEVELQNSDFLWHQLFFIQQLPKDSCSNAVNVTGQGIVIAVLDVNVSPRNKPGCIDSARCDNLNIFSKNTTKMATGQGLVNCRFIDQKTKDRAAELMGKKQFVIQLLLKNHGDISMTLIQQIAPNVQIILIPILDEYGNADKQKLYDGLLQAYQAKVDIVHMGLQLYDLDITQELDRKIVWLIQKFKYVVASAGNYGTMINHVGYPAALPGVISVGSCSKKGERYQLSDFCQVTRESPIDFVMPGENIWISLWVDELAKCLIIPVSGTSMSASFMTGALALILEKNNEQLEHDRIMELIYLCSKNYDISWNGYVTYGTPEIRKILIHLHNLNRLKKKKVDRYFYNLRIS